MEPSYRYRAELDRVVDGDTYVLAIDLGFRIWAHLKVRLRGADAPERGEEGWSDSQAVTQTILEEASEIVVESYKDQQSFERWVCDVWVDGRELAALLIEAGAATE